jgi:hypothetical protein
MKFFEEEKSHEKSNKKVSTKVIQKILEKKENVSGGRSLTDGNRQCSLPARRLPAAAAARRRGARGSTSL